MLAGHDILTFGIKSSVCDKLSLYTGLHKRCKVLLSARLRWHRLQHTPGAAPWRHKTSRHVAANHNGDDYDVNDNQRKQCPLCVDPHNCYTSDFPQE